MSRELPRRDYDALKAASRRLVSLAGGPSEAARITRGSQSRISEAISHEQEDRFLAIDQVADLEAACGMPVMSIILADLMQQDLVPRAAASAEGGLTHALMAVTRLSAQVQVDVMAAMQAKEISAADLQAIKRRVTETVTALHRLTASIEGETSASTSDNQS